MTDVTLSSLETHPLSHYSTPTPTPRAMKQASLFALFERNSGFASTRLKKLDRQVTYQSATPMKEGYSLLSLRKIRSIGNPQVAQQLLEIHRFLLSKNIRSHKFLDRCIDVALQEKFIDPRYSEINKQLSSKILGKIIFLLEKDHDRTIHEMTILSLKESYKWVNSVFDNFLNEIQNEVAEIYNNHQTFGFQPPPLAAAKALRIKLVNILITNEETINLGIISSLRERFTQRRGGLFASHEVNLGQGLRLLENSVELRRKLMSISAPEDKTGPVNMVIRADLALSTREEIRSVHAKRVALAGMLSQVRQGEAKSCFAASLAKDLLSDHPEQCLTDFSSLLSTSKLERTVNNKVYQFPFLTNIGNENLKKIISIDNNGYVIGANQDKIPLAESIAFKHICKALRIENSHHIVQEIVQQAFRDEGKTSGIIKMSIDKILHKVVDKVCDPYDSSNTPEILYTKAYLAFESETNNTLLKVWENALAGMAETQTDSPIKKAIIETIVAACEKHFKTLPAKYRAMFPSIANNLREEFKKSVELLYDPNITHGTNEEGLPDTQGGFVLYDRNDEDPTKRRRIDNPKDFQHYIMKHIQRDSLFWTENGFQGITERELNKVIDSIRNFVAADTFLVSALTLYFQPNTKVEDPLNNYSQLQNTPWVTKSGHDALKVLNIYLESSSGIATEKIVPINAETLLEKVIQIGRNISLRERLNYSRNPHKLMPMRISKVHSFSLMLGHPSLAKAWKGRQPIQEWMNKEVIEPGKALSNSIVDARTRTGILKTLAKDIKHFDQQKIFWERAAKFPLDINFTQLRGMLKDIITEIYPTDEIGARIRKIDHAICNKLEPSLKKKLQTSTVHFADTNWSKERRGRSHDLHFCLVVNPGTGNLELMKSYDDGAKFIPLDQEYWLRQSWEFYSQQDISSKMDLRA